MPSPAVAAPTLPSRTMPPARASGTTIASAEQLGGRDSNHVVIGGITRDRRSTNPRHCIGFRIETVSRHTPTAIYPHPTTVQLSETIYARRADALADMQRGRASADLISQRVIDCATSIDCLFFGSNYFEADRDAHRARVRGRARRWAA